VLAEPLAGQAVDLHAARAGVNDGQRQRDGRRSNGSVFTVDTLGRYVAYDVHDVGG